MTTEYVEKLYNRYSSFYDLIWGKVFHSGREKIPDLLPFEKDDHVLEVGIGTGLSIPFVPAHVRLTGIDLSQNMLDEAAKRLQGMRRKNVELIKMDATNLDFPDNTFDHVLAAYFISTVPDPVRVVEEMKRVCKPGGVIVFLNHFQSDNRWIAAFDRLISPLTYRLGFYFDLNLPRLLKATNLVVDSKEKIDPLAIWKAIRIINTKPG